jgi:predicted nucleotidyltransferase
MENHQRLLAQFYYFPTKSFYLRELSRSIALAPLSTRRYLDALHKAGLIVRETHDLYPKYRANQENERFRQLKKLFFMQELYDSNLLTALERKCRPKAIILFGSACRGEDIETSDVDIAVFSGDIPIDMVPFESRFHRKINVFFVKDFGKLSKELKNNLLNGVIMYGYMDVF